VDSLLKQSERPSQILVASENAELYFLFILQSQLYAAAQWREPSFRNLSLREFFTRMGALQKPAMHLWQTDPVYFKCLLTVCQRFPTTSGTTDLLNVETLLNRIKESGKETVMTLQNGQDLSLFYFAKGRLYEGYFSDPAGSHKEGGLEEALLVYAYSATQPLEVHTYQDLLVQEAEDMDPECAAWPGGVADFFLRTRPELLFILAGKTMEKAVIQKRQFSIGRQKECDLVITDSSASRRHAVIVEEQGRYFLEDLNSRNGTLLNGQKVGRSTLKDGDEIQIGGFKAMFVIPEASKEPPRPMEAAETTTFVPSDRPASEPVRKPSIAAAPPPLRLEVVSGGPPGTFTVITKAVMGRTKADININDPKVSRRHGQIELGPDGYVFTDLNSTNGSFINNEQVTAQPLKSGDMIRIGDTVMRVSFETE
jgi:pSer/pThr/pTyr-binding forkhead associated (FHA) protein